MVGTVNASTNAPADAAVVLVKETGKGLAVTVDVNSRYVYADPYKGAMMAVAEAARNIVCSGGVPLGVTNCLNFGNPYDPEVYYQFVNAVKGMGEACLKFDTPVTGGNVSFYNQGPDGPVFPTPTIGMVGLVEDLSKKMTLNFKAEGDIIYLLGEIKNDIASSQYLSKICGVHHSPAPAFDLEEEFQLQQVIMKLIEQGAIESAHDIAEGGLLTALLESGFHRELGFAVNAALNDVRKDAFLFGEAQSRVIVTIKASEAESFEKGLRETGLSFHSLGTVTDGEVKINGESWGEITEWKELYDTAIEKHLIKELDSEGALSLF
jgi:phosphoribosylformylglycinamidine synthase